MALTKLTITAYTTDAYTTAVGGDDFKVQINPESWKEEFNIVYSPSRTTGALATKLRLDHIDSGKLTLNLVFDGTGLVSTTPPSLQGVSVADQITSFKTLTMQPNGDIHEPNYLMLVWGTFSFQGVLTNLTIDYPLVTATGTPLRAKATATFATTQSLATATKAAGVNSPDMTHTRPVVAGDTLSQMTYNIYGDPKYYLLVAKTNGLNQVRQLTKGTTLNFPPLKQK